MTWSFTVGQTAVAQKRRPDGGCGGCGGIATLAWLGADVGEFSRDRISVSDMLLPAGIDSYQGETWMLDSPKGV
jgi:hypothetical protein